MMRMNPFLLAITVSTAAAAAFGQSQQPFSALKGHNSGAPIDWAADRIEVQSNAHRVYFNGSVVAKQAELTLRAPKVTVAYDTEGGLNVQRIDAAGGVHVQSPSEDASGDFAVYDLQRRLITMVGNVELRQSSGSIRGQRLTIDLQTGYASMSGGRVSGTLTPKRIR